MKPLKIYFSDFWTGFDYHNNLLLNYLKAGYDVSVVPDADLLIYSCFGKDHLNFKGPKIFYSGENAKPDFRECDHAFTFYYESFNGRNTRFPLYRWQVDLEKLTEAKDPVEIFRDKTKFCCMLVSNPHCAERNSFFQKLSAYKKVDSGGAYMNNVGGRVKDKTAFIHKYKFVLSFENSSTPGYTTEKIAEPMFVHSVPVYWGNPLIGSEFNTGSFVNIHDFSSFDEAIGFIKKLDNDDEAYKQMLAEPYFKENELPEEMTHKYFETKWLSAVADVLSKPFINKGIRRSTNKMRAFTRRLISLRSFK